MKTFVRPVVRPVLVRTLAASLMLVASASISACGDEAAVSSPSSTTPATPGASQGQPVVVDDAWVKTVDSGMTAVFGTLRNTSGAAVTITSATTTASSRAELHEVAMSDGKMVMRPKAGGFTVPAHGRHPLAPGGDHIMVLDLRKAVRPGDEVTITLTLKDKRTISFTALAKQTSGGEEEYPSTTGPAMGESMGAASPTTP